MLNRFKIKPKFQSLKGKLKYGKICNKMEIMLKLLNLEQLNIKRRKKEKKPYIL
jgi:hypothetical protein